MNRFRCHLYALSILFIMLVSFSYAGSVSITISEESNSRDWGLAENAQAVDAVLSIGGENTTVTPGEEETAASLDISWDISGDSLSIESGESSETVTIGVNSSSPGTYTGTATCSVTQHFTNTETGEETTADDTATFTVTITLYKITEITGVDAVELDNQEAYSVTMLPDSSKAEAANAYWANGGALTYFENVPSGGDLLSTNYKAILLNETDITLSIDEIYCNISDGVDVVQLVTKNITATANNGFDIQYQLPGEAFVTAQNGQTIYVPKGTTVNFQAVLDDPEDTWPYGDPSWSTGDTGETTSKEFSSVSSSLTDTTDVTATSNELTESVKVVVYDIELQVKNKIDGESEYSSSADVAAGGLSSNVHKADIKVKFIPEGVTPGDVTANVDLSVSSGKDSVESSISGGGSTIAEDNNEDIAVNPSTVMTFNSNDKVDDEATVTLTVDGSSINSSVTVNMKWFDISHETFTIPTYFQTDVAGTVTLDPRLSADKESSTITGHDIKMYVGEVTYSKFTYDEETYEITDDTWDVLKNNDTCQQDAIVVDSKTFNDLVAVGGSNPSFTLTPKEYCTSSGGQTTVIWVENFDFAIYDNTTVIDE